MKSSKNPQTIKSIAALTKTVWKATIAGKHLTLYCGNQYASREVVTVTVGISGSREDTYNFTSVYEIPSSELHIFEGLTFDQMSNIEWATAPELEPFRTHAGLPPAVKLRCYIVAASAHVGEIDDLSDAARLPIKRPSLVPVCDTIHLEPLLSACADPRHEVRDNLWCVNLDIESGHAVASNGKVAKRVSVAYHETMTNLTRNLGRKKREHQNVPPVLLNPFRGRKNTVLLRVDETDDYSVINDRESFLPFFIASEVLQGGNSVMVASSFSSPHYPDHSIDRLFSTMNREADIRLTLSKKQMQEIISGDRVVTTDVAGNDWELKTWQPPRGAKVIRVSDTSDSSPNAWFALDPKNITAVCGTKAKMTDIDMRINTFDMTKPVGIETPTSVSLIMPLNKKWIMGEV